MKMAHVRDLITTHGHVIWKQATLTHLSILGDVAHNWQEAGAGHPQ